MGQLVEILVPLPSDTGEEIDEAEEEEDGEGAELEGEEERGEEEEETLVGVVEEELEEEEEEEEEKDVGRGSVQNGNGGEVVVKMVVGGERGREGGGEGEGKEVEKDGQPGGEQNGLFVLAEEAEQKVSELPAVLCHDGLNSPSLLPTILHHHPPPPEDENTHTPRGDTPPITGNKRQ